MKTTTGSTGTGHRNDVCRRTSSVRLAAVLDVIIVVTATYHIRTAATVVVATVAGATDHVQQQW